MPTLGVTPDEELLTQRLTRNLTGGTHNVEHAAPFTFTDDVGVTAGCSEAFVVRRHHGDALGDKRQPNDLFYRADLSRRRASIGQTNCSVRI